MRSNGVVEWSRRTQNPHSCKSDKDAAPCAFEPLFSPTLPEQTGDAARLKAPVFFASPLLPALFGLPADACVDLVRWGRKSRGGTEQSCGFKLRTDFGIDFSLDAHDGTAARVETRNRNHDLAAHLRCAAIGRGDKGHTAGNLKYGLGAVETIRRTIVNGQGVGKLPARDHRMASRKTDTQAPGKVRLSHNELVEKRGSSRRRRRDIIARMNTMFTPWSSKSASRGGFEFASAGKKPLSPCTRNENSSPRLRVWKLAAKPPLGMPGPLTR